MPEHPYQEVSLPEWNAAPFDAALDPPVNAQDLVFTGACPRCDHPMTFRRPISVAVGLRDAGADDAKEAIEALREAGMLRGPQSAVEHLPGAIGLAQADCFHDHGHSRG